MNKRFFESFVWKDIKQCFFNILKMIIAMGLTLGLAYILLKIAG